jgi:hypothetical protein
MRVARPFLALAALCLTLAACAPGASPPAPPPAAPGVSGGDLLFLRQGPAFAPDAVTAVLATADQAAAFRGWFAASPDLWDATAELAEPLRDTAIVAFVQPVGCDTVGAAALEVRGGMYALALRDVVRHPECLVAHQAAAAFRIRPRNAESFFAAGFAPGGDPAVHVAAPALRPGAFEVTDAAALPVDVRETVSSRLRPGTRVFAFVGPACDAVRPLLVIDPTRLRVPPCPGGGRFLTAFAVPDRLVPPGARPA